MAYRPELRIQVEVPVLGDPAPVFWFGTADTEWTRFAGKMSEVSGRGTEFATVEGVPVEVAGILCEFVVAALRDWRGVDDEQGKPRPFSRRWAQDLPTRDKLLIGGAYLQAMADLTGKQNGSAEQPMTSPDPEPDET